MSGAKNPDGDGAADGPAGDKGPAGTQGRGATPDPTLETAADQASHFLAAEAPVEDTGPPPDLVRQTAVGAGWMIAWRLVTRCLGLVSTLVLARILVPADFGLIAMASTFAQAVEQMSQLGLGDALVRRRGPAHELFDAAFTLQLGRGVLTAALLAAFAPAAAWWFDEPRLIAVVLVLAAGSLISGLENIAIAEFRRDMRFGMQFKLLSVPRLVQVGLTVPLALVLQSYWALLAGIVIGRLARTVMTYSVHSYRPRLRLSGWRELAGFSFWTWATTLINVMWDRSDPFVVGPALGAATLGTYLLAVEIGTLPVSELIAPAAEAMFAGFASAQNRGRSSTGVAPLVATALCLATLPVVLAISAASGQVVLALLGPRWAAAQPLVAIAAWQCVFSPFGWVTTMALVANGHVRANFVAHAAAAVVKVAVMVAAVRLTGDIAVVTLAGTACVGFESLLFVLLLRGTGQVRLRACAGALCRGVAATMVTAGALSWSGWGWRPGGSSVPEAVLCGAGLGLFTLGLYGLVLFALWRACGRPDSAEAAVARFLVSGGRQAMAPLLRRLGRAG